MVDASDCYPRHFELLRITLDNYADFSGIARCDGNGSASM